MDSPIIVNHNDDIVRMVEPYVEGKSFEMEEITIKPELLQQNKR